MTPTDLLRDEHRLILEALDVLERAADRMAAGGAVGDAWWTGVVAWLRTFADRNHHSKEEAALFPAIVKAGAPSEGGPIAVMLEEHVEGRCLLTALDVASGAARLGACRAYVALLRAHIDKENGIVFPLAEAVLDARAMLGLQREFEAVRAEVGAAATVAAAEAALGRLDAALEAAA
jgi:hemerythrin-like domain-containing protein